MVAGGILHSSLLGRSSRQNGQRTAKSSSFIRRLDQIGMRGQESAPPLEALFQTCSA